MKVTYTVSGMTCGGCLKRVQAALSQHAQSAQVTLQPPAAVLENPALSLAKLNEILAGIGHYQLHEIEQKSIEVPALKGNIHAPSRASFFVTYKPLLLVFAYILLVTLTVEIAHGAFILHRWMPNFMAGFFLVFSFFKLLDVRGFAGSYAMYDLLAQKIPAYGFVYPFIELGLGVAYLLVPGSIALNWLTLILMGFSTTGVLRAVLNKQTIRCACLGTGFNLPMSTVTLIEDLLMVAMAAWMLI